MRTYPPLQKALKAICTYVRSRRSRQFVHMFTSLAISHIRDVCVSHGIVKMANNPIICTTSSFLFPYRR